MSAPRKTHKYLGLAILCMGLLLVVFFIKYSFFASGKTLEYVANNIASQKIIEKVEEKKAIHINTPEPLKSIYMTQCVVGTKAFRESLVKIAGETEINAIVIDIKDYTGRIAFDTENPQLIESISDKCGASDMREFVEILHEKGIYVIGRVAVFQDPYMVKKRPDLAVQSKSTGGVWKDYKGLSFIDVGAREHWDYIIEIAKEAYKIGFDEINFDYVRFPSDGNMDDVSYVHSVGKTKPDALKEFFSYLHDKLKDTGIKTSVDIFGMTTTSFDDLNIGQLIENTFPYFDYVAPMVYPSHYPKNFNGWKNPNDHVYEVVNFAMNNAVNRANTLDSLIGSTTATTTPTSPPTWYKGGSAKKLRTWIQDFDYGGNYDIAEVKAQIKASNDAGVQSWMVWSPSNKYTTGALLKE
ncbi:MAG: putative glycoside hydrolase [Candidatus Paceibacterota bacterium]